MVEASSRRSRTATLLHGTSVCTRRLALFATIALVALVAVLFVAPDVDVDVDSLGQHVSIGAQHPDLSLSGPAQLAYDHHRIDVQDMHVIGPLRPQITLAAIERNQAAGAGFQGGPGGTAFKAAGTVLLDGIRTWWIRTGLMVVVLSALLCAFVISLRHYRGLRHPIWTILAAAGMGAAVWLICTALVYSAAQQLSHAKTLEDLFGREVLHQSAQAVGPYKAGYDAAVIGDSRAAHNGGTPLPQAGPDDLDCQRSGDSLAALLGQVKDWRILNLACSGASTTEGLFGPQVVGNPSRLVPSQVGQLKQLINLKLVVVSIGPNDLRWGDQIGICLTQPVCDDRLSVADYETLRDRFRVHYDDLLQELRDLPSHPQVIIVQSYDGIDPHGSCELVTRLGPDKINVLAARNAELNAILADGAKLYSFGVARPRLQPLCGPDDGRHPDLYDFTSPFVLHPTTGGEWRIVAAVLEALGDLPKAIPAPAPIAVPTP